jgi:tricorn protease
LGFPPLMDGGTVTAPNVRIFSPSGEWIAENTGVSPDVEVELDPKAVASGRDPQLERAVAIAMEQLQKNPPPQPRRPAYPDYQRPASGSQATPSTR